MIKDVEVAFFSQLSYLDWNKLNTDDLSNITAHNKKDFLNFLTNEQIWNKIKKDDLLPFENDGVLMYGEEDKRLFGVFGIEKDGHSNKMKPLYDFNGWQFLYSANKRKLYKDKYNIELEDDGFYATAFIKDNNIVIAYRGTESNKLSDLLADIEIAFFKENNSQLVSSYLFLKYIEEKYLGKNIYITGHSLGGCLAQYAYISSGKKYKTVTWNALGVGTFRDKIKEGLFFKDDIRDYLKASPREISAIIKNKYISENGAILLNDEIKDKKEIESLISEYFKKNLATFFFTGTASKNHHAEAKDSALQIYWLLKSIKNIQDGENIESNNITNYYNSLDWTPLLQTREGKIVDVLTDFANDKDSIPDEIKTLWEETVDKLGFKHHGVNDFLIYMNENGYIESKKYNKFFTANLIKTLILHLKENQGFEIDEDLDKVTQEIQALLNNEDITIRYKDSAKRSLTDKCHGYIKHNPQDIKNNKIKKCILGHSCNVDSLAGISGGLEKELA